MMLKSNLKMRLCKRHLQKLQQCIGTEKYRVDREYSFTGLTYQVLKRLYATSGEKAIFNKEVKIDVSQYPPERVRNFSIIAHVDHGKSTLADRLLEITGTISSRQKNEQVLDRLQVERERGITVKAQTASLFYTYKGENYLLNLVDTPGHVDFNYEVARSLAACQGVILLVDANQGVQAQTVANMFLAWESDLEIIPVLNKIDLPYADPEAVAKQIGNLLPVEESDILKISAKTGLGVEEVLKTVIEKIPPPVSDWEKPAKALLFDSYFENYKGVICNLAIIDGAIHKGDKIIAHSTQREYVVQNIGILYPKETPTDVLYGGQVGYITAGIKTSSEAVVGDTFYLKDSPVEPLPGFKPAKPMVFAGIFPPDQSQLSFLRDAINKLVLNDSSVSVDLDSSASLGQGWRLGFLGLLHMDVFQQRLEQEFNASVIVTAPNIPYKVKIQGAKYIKQYGSDEITVLNPCRMPDSSVITEYQEPLVLATIIFPVEYIGAIINLVLERRGEQIEQTQLDNTRVLMKVKFPLNEILVDFFDILKSITSGYASFDYEDFGYQVSEMSKVSFFLNDVEVEDMTMICHISKARNMAKKICAKLKEKIPRQLFKVSVKGKVGSQIIAREDINALRKDVTAKCYGGDITRKNKLLAKQAEGKKKMRQIGSITVPKNVFIDIVRKD
ncbi:hypothetical protein FSP39_015946 [Pinctada imbricata]|uniref:Translation factor GUF1 homolog, mitochondrial n=1 Tax=Pinctada imbricata TaxID=66713 RepID=A0AA88Y959_PINIB|nr:hypothetical protein FSP39_015946 [Pinctada imbricata]